MSRRWRRILLWGAGVCLVGMGLVVSARHVIAHKAVETGFHKITGFPLHIGSLRISLFQSRLEARQIKLLNPTNFSDRLFADVPRLCVDYEYASLVRRQPHLTRLDLEI